MQPALLCYFLLTPLCLTAHLLAQDFQVVSGSASATHTDNLTTIENSPHAILHWENFSIAEKHHVHFAQINAASTVLNRVTGSNISALMGTLTSNGQVFLLNPNGVLIGPNAVIQTAGFLASTAHLSNDQFLAGKELLFLLPGEGKIVNQGHIDCGDGNIFLIAKDVINEGKANADFIGIGSALEVLIQPHSSERMYIRPDPIDVGEVINKGSLEALAIELRSSSAYAKAIRVEGPDGKLTTQMEGGRIILSAEQSAVVIEGTIAATGGVVQVGAKQVVLGPEGKIEAEKGAISVSATEKGIYNEGSLIAHQGNLVIRNTSPESPFYNLGTLDASGQQGGSIQVNTVKLINFGNILAEGTLFDGGSIEIKTHGPYIETTRGLISVSGKQAGGSIFLHSDTSLFSSGTYTSQGTFGGTISLLAPTLTLVSAEIDASGSGSGGQIFVGGGAHGKELGAPNAETTHLSGDTRLSANATESGDGGTVVVWSEKKTVCYGKIEANAGARGGDGGWIEVSSKDELYCRAGLSAHAPHGAPGAVLLDPKNIVIDAVTGVYPQYQFIDPNSGGGSGFGNAVSPLSTGNVVITKPNDNAAAVDAGAVYLYNGHTAALISTLTGSTANDQVGNGSSTFLDNGNYVVSSDQWNNGLATSAGAVTWINGTTGVSGVVSSTNSLVGSTTGDQVGSFGFIVLTNNNYVVRSINWNSNSGAATWGNGTTGISGVVSSSNSLVGVTPGEPVGNGGIFPLTNGNYVVNSPPWNNVGAVTWGNGSTGITGTITSSNSLVGTTAGDQIGLSGILALTNGNYVVSSPLWNDGATADVGAVTWGDGSTGITGVVSSLNSLIGTTLNDQIGSQQTYALSNGNYVVPSPLWDDGATANVGAVTWGDGTTGIVGTVSSSNSLIGSTAADRIGLNGVLTLNNGNYVVRNEQWNNGGAISNAGAVTWGDGTTGITGAVSSSNSLVGTTASDLVGREGVIALTNGNYVVSSRFWNDGATAGVGAVTWGNGTTGITGPVTTTNSLVGTTVQDRVGIGGSVALSNGNYVAVSFNWNNGAALNVGAVTWGDGTTGITGPVTTTNSLVGTTTLDQIGGNAVVALTNGNYVVISQDWTDGAIANVGAVTWGDGSTGVTGAVTSANSLVGSTTADRVGNGFVAPLFNGNYIVLSPDWDNGAIMNAGAATWGDGSSGTSGVVSASNSVVGSTANDQIGNTFPITLLNGNYVLLSPNWDNGAVVDAGAATWGDGSIGVSGPITPQNSIIGQSANSGLSTQGDDRDDLVNGTFFCAFVTEGSGVMRVGLQSPNQIDFSRAQAQDMTITPSFLTDTLNTGTAVTLQANNNITISSPITSSPGAGALTLSAGKSALIDANINTANAPLTITANDLLSSGVVDAYRDPGDATLSVANGVTIDTGTGSLTLSLLNGAGKTNAGSGDLTIGDNATLQCSGSGAMTLTAQENNITLGNNALLQTVDGTITLSAGVSITGSNPFTLQTTGTGELILITDALFPTAPLFGNGAASFPLATLTTAGGRLLIYTSQRSLNTVPATINGTPYVPGPEFVDSVTEKWGTYYPNSSGIPFTIFYKQTSAVPPTPPTPPVTPSASSQSVIANQGTLADLISIFIVQKAAIDCISSFEVPMDSFLFCDFESGSFRNHKK